ncbi:MAG: NUDIX hydrolase [Candidatus Marinimicrobia bacterium CG08_land_8_20_14_0_20_45_22]|nr:MAG: NUDIX hydrolase [Candidatus Marinimicrobia bacterium CG08_land_8_20_14_0_20_45_22]
MNPCKTAYFLDMKYRFCYQCGHPMEQVNIEGRIRTFCPACKAVLYENPIPSVAILAENDRNEILLVKRNVEPGKGGWSLAGGFIEMGETPENGAIRELKEETGLNGIQPTLFDVKIHLNGYYGDILIVIYRMILQSFEILPGDDVQDARFFKIDERPQLVFSIHEQLLKRWLSERESKKYERIVGKK